MDEKLLANFNQVEQFHWWWAGRQHLVKQLLKKDHPKSILDIGCGTGQTLTFLSQVFPQAKLFGIDALPEAVKYSQERGHEVLLSDALHLPYPANTFDAVLLLDVVEHIKADVQVIAEAKRVLKPGGVLVITSPALQFIWSAHDANQGHFRRYTRRRMRTLARQNKLHIEFLSYFNFVLAPPIIAIRLLSRLPVFGRLGDYDSRLNYNLAYNGTINSLLKFLFITEIKLLKIIHYPFGISVAAKFVK